MCVLLHLQVLMAATRPEPSEDQTLTSADRIRNAALRCFASRGTSATSLRTVASEAGVSLGLVQHHFVTKANLIKAVDDHVLEVMSTTLAQPIPEPPADSIADEHRCEPVALSVRKISVAAIPQGGRRRASCFPGR